MKKVVVASDSFKGSLSSSEIAQSAETAIRSVFPECEVIKLSVADGGEGTVEALTATLNGILISCEVHDPLMRPITATYGISGNGEIAIIEMAAASGLTLIPAHKRNPMLTTTYGTGELIKDALQKGCRQFLIGIGGSATNDGGTGMLQALGFRFFNKEGNELNGKGEILSQIYSIDDSHVSSLVKEVSFRVACDVSNPFYGKNGAAYIFAPQKGADNQMINELDAGLQNFATVIRESGRKVIDQIPGAGAAGGLGGAFVAFLNAELKPGVNVVLETIGFTHHILNADLIITGEGKLDTQTMMGKTPAGILKAAQKQNIPVIAIGGSVEEFEFLNQYGFLSILPILPSPVSLAQAMDKEFTRKNIIHTLEQYLRGIQYFTRK